MRVLREPLSLRQEDEDLRLFFLGVGWAFSQLHNQTNLLIVKGKDHLLVDLGTTGSRALKELAGLAVTDIAYVLPTHSHADHIGGLEELALRTRFGGAPRPRMVVTPAYQERLWEESLRGGLAHNKWPLPPSGSGDPSPGLLAFTDFFEPLRPTPVPGADRETCRIAIGSLQVELFRTRHIPEEASSWESSFWSCGLLIDGRVFYSGDTRFDPQLLGIYGDAEWFFHDCQFRPGGVHAGYEELKGLPAEVRRRMLLMHYDDDWRGYQPRQDGFCGFAEQGVQYLF